MVVGFRSRIAEMEKERDEARHFGEEAARKYNELLEDQRILRCAFCDAEYPPGTPATQHEALTEHVKVCEKHPLRAQRDELLTALRRIALEPLTDDPEAGARTCLYEATRIALIAIAKVTGKKVTP